MLKALILDCFGVLYVDPSKHFYEHYVSDPHLRAQLYELNKQADYGFISQQEVVKRVAVLTGLDKKFVQNTIMGEHIINQQLLDYSQIMRSQLKIGMLSNISQGSMERFFTTKQRAKLFDAVVLSEEIGLTKPHPKIFAVMADKIGLPPDECVMIDDVLENCHGADAAGMKWIHYKSLAQMQRELNTLLHL